MDDYVFRRELDLRTNFPEMIVELKTSRQFQKMDLAKKIELYDNIYEIQKKYFLFQHILKEEQRDNEDTTTEQIFERALQEWEKTLQ